MNNEELKELVEKTLKGKEEVTDETVSEVMAAVREAATEKLGPQTFVKVLLDRDNPGLMVTVKRPANRLRLRVHVEGNVKPLPRKADDEDGKKKKATKPKKAETKKAPDPAKT